MSEQTALERMPEPTAEEMATAAREAAELLDAGLYPACLGVLVRGLNHRANRNFAEYLKAAAERDEARKALEDCQKTLAMLTTPDMKVSALHVWSHCVEAEAKARSILCPQPTPQED